MIMKDIDVEDAVQNQNQENENLEEAVNRFQAVYIAEMSRRDRWTERIEAFLKEESF